MLMLLVIFVVIFGVSWFVLRARKPGSDVLRTPPVFPGALPLVGHAYIFGNEDSKVFWQFMRKMSLYAMNWGRTVVIKFGMRDFYVVTDPDDIVTVANTCLEKNLAYDFIKPFLGEGLLTAIPSVWKVHRKLLNPAFYQPVLDGFIDVFNMQAQLLVEALRPEVDKEPFDSWHYIGRNALQTIFLTAMGGHHGDKNLSEKYIETTEISYNKIVTRLQKFWLHNNFLYNWSQLKKETEETKKIIHDLSYSVINEKKRIAETEKKNNVANAGSHTGSKSKTFVDLILDYSGEEGLLTDQEIREEIDTIIVAGHDTSASLTTYMLILLGTYPEIQERVYEEIHDVLGDRPIEKKDYSNLVFIEAVIKETLRLYPIAPVVGRKTSSAVSLKKCTIPANTDVFLNFYGLHRDKSIWGEDAEEFRPDRWLDKARLPEHHAAFAGFSIGRRMCIGKNYALMAIKTSLSYLIRNYRVTADASKLEFKLDIMLKPADGHFISIKNRI